MNYLTFPEGVDEIIRNMNFMSEGEKGERMSFSTMTSEGIDDKPADYAQRASIFWFMVSTALFY